MRMIKLQRLKKLLGNHLNNKLKKIKSKLNIFWIFIKKINQSSELKIIYFRNYFKTSYVKIKKYLFNLEEIYIYLNIIIYII